MTQVVTPPIRPPAAVRTAFWLAVASTVAGGVSAVLIFFDIDLLSGGHGEKVAYGSAGFALVVLALQLLLALRMRAGAGWARIVLTVLMVVMLLAVPGDVSYLAGHTGSVLGLAELAASCLQGLLALGYLGAAHLRGTGAWFRRR
ncbi:hypothetical protein GCM10009827_087720 [Dactylosporangium maewongense]|uniref:Integral membrane protein n=1 Tax=Dactylosporangium maewongense TaxID=634393 RepID=A0ABN2C720_9ACTN